MIKSEKNPYRPKGCEAPRGVQCGLQACTACGYYIVDPDGKRHEG